MRGIAVVVRAHRCSSFALHCVHTPCTRSAGFGIRVNFDTPVHLVESVENCGLCMRRYLACSSYANVIHRELAITRALGYRRTPLIRAPIGFYAKVRVFKARFEGMYQLIVNR